MAYSFFQLLQTLTSENICKRKKIYEIVTSDTLKNAAHQLIWASFYTIPPTKKMSVCNTFPNPSMLGHEVVLNWLTAKHKVWIYLNYEFQSHYAGPCPILTFCLWRLPGGHSLSPQTNSMYRLCWVTPVGARKIFQIFDTTKYRYRKFFLYPLIEQLFNTRVESLSTASRTMNNLLIRWCISTTNRFLSFLIGMHYIRAQQLITIRVEFCCFLTKDRLL